MQLLSVNRILRLYASNVILAHEVKGRRFCGIAIGRFQIFDSLKIKCCFEDSSQELEVIQDRSSVPSNKSHRSALPGKVGPRFWSVPTKGLLIDGAAEDGRGEKSFRVLGNGGSVRRAQYFNHPSSPCRTVSRFSS
jgi:hypothetical protein